VYTGHHAGALRLSPLQIKIWFQNHRYKLKKAQLERRLHLMHNAAAAAAAADVTTPPPLARYHNHHAPAATKRLQASHRLSFLGLTAWRKSARNIRVKNTVLDGPAAGVLTSSVVFISCTLSFSVIGPIPWGHSGPLCHALSLSLWTSILHCHGVRQ